jgi:hypothetical protein
MNCLFDIRKCFDPKHSFYDSAELVNADHWNRVVGDDNIYLTIPYLTALEKALQGKIGFRYILFYNDLLVPVAAAYIQIIQFVGNGLHYTNSISKLGEKIKNKLLASMDAKVLVCGNVFACGENGFIYTKDIEAVDAFKVLSEAIKRLSKEGEKNKQISFSLLKEFWPESVPNADFIRDSSYRGFSLDVNMVLKMHPSWNTMDDYLNSMITKFRTKAKGVFKKSECIISEDFDVPKIIEYKDRIETLYNAVLVKADYKFGALNGQAFANFKEYLGKKFIFKAYFFKDLLIGFSSIFISNNSVDANFVGLDYDFNKEYAIYQRMLYDFVDLSIKIKAPELRLGRTAELIKSSIGAEPVDMKLYVRHTNAISNKLLIPFIASIAPHEFELRLPFNKNFQSA